MTDYATTLKIVMMSCSEYRGMNMANNTALLVIDMQVVLVDGAFQEREVLDRIGTLLGNARASNTPVVYMQHQNDGYAPMNVGAPTWQIHPTIAPVEGDIVLRKRASDSFYETALHDELTAKGINRLVVTGMMTEYCVDTTVRRASSMGYDVTLVADGHTTGDNELMKAPQIIEYHNAVLAELAQPDHAITVQLADQIVF
jgi:nicotinamidase-related amidase